ARAGRGPDPAVAAHLRRGRGGGAGGPGAHGRDGGAARFHRHRSGAHAMTASADTDPGHADPGPGWVRRLLADCLAHRSVLYGALAVSIVATLIDITFPLLTRAALDDA